MLSESRCRVLLTSGVLFLVLAIIVSVPTVSAQDNSTRDGGAALRLSLARAMSLALENNPRLQARAASEEAALQRVEMAKSRFFPKVDLENSYARSNNPVNVFGSKLMQEDFSARDFEIDRLNHPDGRDNLRSAVVFTQPVFNRGLELYGYQSAKLGFAMARAVRDQARQGVLLRVQRSYLRWLLAIRAREVIRDAVATARTNLKIVKARYRNGNALKSDLLQAQVHLAGLRKEQLAYQNQVVVALSALNLAMGLSPPRPWLPVYPDFSAARRKAERAADERRELEHWMALAMKNRPERIFRRLNTETIRWKIKKARMKFLPAVNLRGIYEHNSEGLEGVSGDAYTVMGSVDINLFDGLENVAELKKAKAEKRRALAMEKETEQRIRHQVRKAWLDLRTARFQVEVTRQAVSQANESLRIVRKRYQNGLTIITELLSTETALKRARLQHLQAVYDEQLARAVLRWATGRMMITTSGKQK